MTLSFSNKKLKNFDVSELTVEPRQLRVLDFSFNDFGGQLTFLSHAAFSWLESLDLSNNNIAELPPKMPPQLRKLDVSHNYLQRLGNLASSCRFLISLRAGFNAITILSSENFGADLASLSVEDNGIAAFDNVLDKLPRLHTLRAQNNELADVNDICSQVKRLPELRYLHMSGNPCFTNCEDAKESACYRREIVRSCFGLKTLDGAPVSSIIASNASSPSSSSSPVAVAAQHEQKHQTDMDEVNQLLSELKKEKEEKEQQLRILEGSASPASASSSSALKTRKPNISASASSCASCCSRRDERRKCQTLREMIEKEMKLSQEMQMSVDQLQKQITKEQSLQRGQLNTLQTLRSECETLKLEGEGLKNQVAEQSTQFLEKHAETKRQQVVAALS